MTVTLQILSAALLLAPGMHALGCDIRGPFQSGLRPRLDNGLVLQDASGATALRVNTFAQFRYGASRTAQTTRQTVDLALGRISLSGAICNSALSYFVQAQASTLGAGSSVDVIDSWVQYQPSSILSVQAGRLLLPYSREFYTHPGELLFSDLSIADYAFNLPRSTGVHFSGKMGRVEYHFAAANSVRALDAVPQRNRSSALFTLGRVDLNILRPYGFLGSSPSPIEAPELTVGFAIASNPVTNASALQNVAPGDRTRNATLDAGFRWKRWSLQSAAYFRRNHRDVLSAGNTGDWGAYAQAGFYLAPRRWELAARYAELTFGTAMLDSRSRTAREYTIGVNRYLHQHRLKLQADYTRMQDVSASRASLWSHGLRVQGQFLF